ncbi:cytochrome oxidase assembly factor 4 [Rhizophagus clarus]|uniref:Cytochrome oxidase assembly factor 4 n=1 Tax=Rhizophagus clarus TaxID=94130 RepID=A0A8H3KR21_9GLOM|nr:cytochrome oxidase assembly factor 4 [Rhizophagus clarus]
MFPYTNGKISFYPFHNEIIKKYNFKHLKIFETVDYEHDEYNERIIKTGCAKENEELQLCFADKKDWRLCQKELNNFKECWKEKTSGILQILEG